MPEAIQQAAPFRILRKRDLEDKLRLGKTAIEEKNNPRSEYYDPTFPPPIQLGGTENVRAVGWFEHEIDEWLRKLAERRVAKARPDSDAKPAAAGPRSAQVRRKRSVAGVTT
jgi:prophage regulatory protein